jgi:hypothetical protein
MWRRIQAQNQLRIMTKSRLYMPIIKGLVCGGLPIYVYYCAVYAFKARRY